MQDKAYNSDYRDSLLGFPSVYTKEEDKSADYHRAWAKAIYSRWYNGNTAIPNSFQDDFELLRKYGKGNQPMDMYLKDLDPATSDSSGTVDRGVSSSKEYERAGRNNLTQQIVSI